MLIDFIVGYKLSKRKKRKYRSLNNLLPSIRLDGNLWPFCHSRRRLWLFLLQDCFRRGLSSLPLYLFLFLQTLSYFGKGGDSQMHLYRKKSISRPTDSKMAENHEESCTHVPLPKSKKKCFQIFCTGEINPFSFAEQIVQPGKCGTYCWRIILGDFLQRQYHTFCPCATLLLSTRETGQLFSAFCNLKYLS